VDLRHDGWAIRSQPPGLRDLGSTELWERSLARSQRRREYAALRRTPAYRKKRALVSAALMTATVLAPAHDAARAQGTEVTDASAGMLKLGSRGPEVAAMQRALGISADGIFGHQTKRAVKAFQAAHGLEIDGIIGPITRGALAGGGGGGGGAGSTLPPATTIAVQRALGISADGVFGRQTRRAVKAFQAAHGLEVDGVVGPITLGALGISGSLAPVGGGGGAAGAVAAARTQTGKPYALGGVGPSSFDCSGLTQWAMAQVGITLPRTSFQQASSGVHVDRAAIQAGDLVFFDANGPGASHVGIATGPTTAISATSHGVREHSTVGPYWGAHYYGARRVG
jgi:cell wall-associated NlpC family hydrolase